MFEKKEEHYMFLYAVVKSIKGFNPKRIILQNDYYKETFFVKATDVASKLKVGDRVEVRITLLDPLNSMEEG